MHKFENTRHLSGHSLIELMICCALVLVVMLAIGNGIAFVLKEDAAYKNRAEMMEEMTLVLGIIGDHLSLATNVTTNVMGSDSSVTACFPADGVAFDTNKYTCVRGYDVLWTTSDLRQVISNNAQIAVTNTLIYAQSGKTISFTCLTNNSRSVLLSMSMQQVKLKGGSWTTNSAALSNIWINRWGMP